MSEQENEAIVRELYAAFARNDLPAIIRALAPDSTWSWYGPPEIPFAGDWQGIEGVGTFFKAIHQTVEILEFEPQQFVACGDEVVALGRERVRVKSTEHVYEGHWAMVWTLKHGKVMREREFHNTYAVVAALRAV